MKKIKQKIVIAVETLEERKILEKALIKDKWTFGVYLVKENDIIESKYTNQAFSFYPNKTILTCSLEYYKHRPTEFPIIYTFRQADALFEISPTFKVRVEEYLDSL